MEKTILIDGQKVNFKSNGATALRYKAQFQRDLLKDIFSLYPLSKIGSKNFKVEDLEGFNSDVFYNIAWTMAKTASPAIPEPLEWLEQFDEFPIIEIMPEMQELLQTCLQSSKKK